MCPEYWSCQVVTAFPAGTDIESESNPDDIICEPTTLTMCIPEVLYPYDFLPLEDFESEECTEAGEGSIFRLMNGRLNVPDHTTLSRRNSTLKTSLKRIDKPSGRVNFVIDSTGLVIHDEGRWTRHKHGKRKRIGWLKLHIGVSNVFIVAHYLSADRKTDGEIGPHLIKQVSKIDSITADKGYNQSRVYYMKPQMI